MITVTVGGQEAVTSVELSKPTGEDILNLKGLVEKDDVLSESEIYDKFLRDMANHK